MIVTLLNEYNSIKDQQKELDSKENEIVKALCNYKINFGKYKGLTLSEIAYKNKQYYNWMKTKKVIPKIPFNLDLLILDKINQEYRLKAIEQEQRMFEEQGYRGRYII